MCGIQRSELSKNLKTSGPLKGLRFEVRKSLMEFFSKRIFFQLLNMRNPKLFACKFSIQISTRPIAATCSITIAFINRKRFDLSLVRFSNFIFATSFFQLHSAIAFASFFFSASLSLELLISNHSTLKLKIIVIIIKPFHFSSHFEGCYLNFLISARVSVPIRLSLSASKSVAWKQVPFPKALRRTRITALNMSTKFTIYMITQSILRRTRLTCSPFKQDALLVPARCSLDAI